MSGFLVLTADIAEKVAGRSPKDGSAVLRPVPLKDGTFTLPDRVLDDPAHEDVRDVLALLPRTTIEKLPRYTEEDEPPPDALEPKVMVVRDNAVTKTEKLALAEPVLRAVET